MKDFRHRLVRHTTHPSEVTALLRKGQLAKALRKARQAGVPVSQEQIDSTARAMFRAGRAGELLAMIGSVDVKLPFDTVTLLNRSYEVGDHHTFLKQAHRLAASVGLEQRVTDAILAIAHRAPEEAAIWRRKFHLR